MPPLPIAPPPFFLSGTGAVEGKTVDADTGRSVEGATVLLRPCGRWSDPCGTGGDEPFLPFFKTAQMHNATARRRRPLSSGPGGVRHDWICSVASTSIRKIHTTAAVSRSMFALGNPISRTARGTIGYSVHDAPVSLVI